MADITTIANQFTTFYYQTFDANRQGLAQLYVSFQHTKCNILINNKLFDNRERLPCSPSKVNLSVVLLILARSWV